MLLFHGLINAVDSDGVSFIDFFCEESIRAEVQDFFQSSFEEAWENAEEKVEEEYGDCYELEEEMECPADARISEFGVRVILQPLYLSYCQGDGIDENGYAKKALKRVLKKVEKKFPQISYEGHIAFPWFDSSSGGVEQYELAYNRNDAGTLPYDYIGARLHSALEHNAERFWDRLNDNLADSKDYLKALKSLQFYEKWILEDTYDKLIDLADEKTALALKKAMQDRTGDKI